MYAPATNQSQRRARHHGFTLIEVLIVVAIIGILARIAYPAYVDYAVRGKIPQATNNLATLQTKMEQYFQDQRTYLNGTDCGGALKANMPVNSYFTFSCDTVTATTYSISATGQGQMASFKFTVNQDGTRATTGAPTGWPTSTSCWITKKDGTC